MKNTGTIVAAVFLGIVLLLYMCTFQVRFTEVAIKKTWGEARDQIAEPGLKAKWPYPIQSVVCMTSVSGSSRIARRKPVPWTRRTCF